MRTRLGTKLVAAVAALTMPLALAACGLDKEDTTADVEAGSIDAEALKGVDVTVGSKDFDESITLGYITLLALKAAGANVTDKTNIQGSTATREALIGGDIDVYWDYTGTGWITYLQHDKPITDSQEQYTAVKDEDLKKNKILWGTPAPMNNTYAMAVNDEFAQETGVATLSDMAALSKSDNAKATVCIESEFSARPDGFPGMVKHYGMKIPSSNVKKYGTGVIYDQIDKGENCNFGEVFATDGRIKALGLTVLEDDKGFFPIYNAAPVVMDTNKNADAILGVLEPISEKLTDEKMAELNAQVSSDGEKPETVAENFLRDEGFIK